VLLEVDAVILVVGRAGGEYQLIYNIQPNEGLTSMMHESDVAAERGTLSNNGVSGQRQQYAVDWQYEILYTDIAEMLCISPSMTFAPHAALGSLLGILVFGITFGLQSRLRSIFSRSTCSRRIPSSCR